MIRNVIRIEEDKCDGCGICATACMEGAIAIVDGKARLVSETYCDGLGGCIGECPRGAITIEARDAAAFDEKAVAQRSRPSPVPDVLPCGCPGTHVQAIAATPAVHACCDAPVAEPVSCLGNWPVQLRLVPPTAPFLQGADLVVCADCVPFAVPDFHSRYLAGRVVLVGCPKLDDLASDQKKLTAILGVARPRRVTVLRMEVPCCAGIAQAVLAARDEAIPGLPVEVHTIGIRGGIDCRTM